MKTADQIILGKIYTLDSDKMLVEAMAVRDGIIVYVGSRDIAMKMKGDNTEILDYGNAAIYPGFMDAHTHGPMAGTRLVISCDLVGGNSMEEFAQMMGDFIRKHPGRKVYTGAGWIYYEEPTAALLDKYTGDIPVSLTSIDGHSVWLNSAAIKLCGIDQEAVKQYGTAQIHVDKDGNPSGLVCEGAQRLVGKHFMFTVDEIKEGLLAWQEFAFSNGITAVGEALLDMYPAAKDAYAQLVEEGKWKLRTYSYAACQGASTLTDPDKMGEQLTALKEKYDSEYFKITGMKFIMDGVVEAHTAFLSQEYSDEEGYFGVQNEKNQERFTRAVISANNAGFGVHVHTVGDAASHFVLNSFQEAEEKNCNFDARNCLAHLQLISKEDIKRCADYNVIAIVAPLWASYDPHYMAQTINYIGEDRAWMQYPIKDFEDVGATIVFHTDYPITSLVDIPKTVYQAIKRQNPDMGARSTLDADQGISSVRALLAMTINTAYMFRQEHHLGTLHVGKVANASVYDQDFIDYKEVKDIAKAKLIATIIDGKVVYSNK